MPRIEVRGRTFDVPRLSLDDAFATLELAQEIFGAAKPPLGKVPQLLRAFAKNAKVARTPDGRFEGAAAEGAALVLLSAFEDDVFGGELGLAFDFVAKCVEQEHGSFLDGVLAAQAKAAPAPKP